MLLEATRILEDGIVRDPRDVDLGLIFGIGFPPFRGAVLGRSTRPAADPGDVEAAGKPRPAHGPDATVIGTRAGGEEVLFVRTA